MKIKKLVLLAVLAVILGMFCACEGLLNKDDEKALDLSEAVLDDEAPDFSDMKTLAEKLAWIKKYAKSDETYYLVVSEDESLAPQTLSYSGKGNITIQLIGIGGVRTIELNGTGSLFRIEDGVTLVLNENIVLKGKREYIYLLVSVIGGNLILNDGSKITGGGVSVNYGTFTMNGGTISGNTIGSPGGGVSIANGGTFTMNGGTISGNTAATASSGGSGGGVHVTGGTFTMNGGVISGNTAPQDGGGVFINAEGTFTMNGGIISGNTARLYGGGVFSSVNGTFTMHGGTISGNTAFYGGGVSGGTFQKLPPVGEGQNSGIIYGNGAVGNDANGVPLQNTALSNGYGHAVFIYAGVRDTTAGQTDRIDTTTGRGLSTSGYEPFVN